MTRTVLSASEHVHRIAARGRDNGRLRRRRVHGRSWSSRPASHWFAGELMLGGARRRNAAANLRAFVGASMRITLPLGRSTGRRSIIGRSTPKGSIGATSTANLSIAPERVLHTTPRPVFLTNYSQLPALSIATHSQERRSKRLTNLFSENLRTVVPFWRQRRHELLVAQGARGLDAHRAARRQVGREARDEQHECEHAYILDELAAGVSVAAGERGSHPLVCPERQQEP